MPQSKLYIRINQESELAVKANEKKFSKYNIANFQKAKDKKDKAAAETRIEDKKPEK